MYSRLQNQKTRIYVLSSFWLSPNPVVQVNTWTLCLQNVVRPLKEPRCMFKMKVLVAQLHLTLCDPMNWSPPGYSLHRLVQARILEWVAIPFSRVWATREAPRILECVASPNPGIEPRSPALRADSSPSEPRGKASCVLHLPRSSSQFSSVIQSVRLFP